MLYKGQAAKVTPLDKALLICRWMGWSLDALAGVRPRVARRIWQHIKSEAEAAR